MFILEGIGKETGWDLNTKGKGNKGKGRGKGTEEERKREQGKREEGIIFN